MASNQALFNYCLRLGDNSLILGSRLGEWCSKGPFLEEDIALTNIALDKIGQAQALLKYAGELEGKGRTEDDLAYKRDERNFFNSLLVEQPNGDFAYTLARQLYNDVLDYLFYKELLQSKDETLAALSGKFIKEIKYHIRHVSDWIIRLGDGTEESHSRMQKGLNELWQYTGDLFAKLSEDEELIKNGFIPDVTKLKEEWQKNIATVLEEATLKMPENTWMQSGSRKGIHTEHLGYMLAEMQYLQRSYPDAKW